MNFDDTTEEAAFRAEARAWLDGAAPLKVEGGAAAPSLTDARSAAEAEHVRRCKEWQGTLYEGGWAGITWPKEYGGRGGTSMQQQIFNQEQARYDAPGVGIFAVGIGMTGPTLIAHGNDEQKRRYLDPLLRGEEVWCQLFSEPGAGSDLAGLSTRAERDGDEFVVNGQKVWTSGAHYSDWGILLARTDPDQPKHRGLTYFVVDMRTPGIDVRPLRQITGAAHFNEVFLTDVRIPAANVVGEVNQGWRVAMSTLTSERSLIGGGRRVGFPELLRLARQFGRTDEPVVRQALATAYIRLEVLKYLGWRAQTATSQGVAPGPESSVLKLGHSRHMATFSAIALGLQGPMGAIAGVDGHENGQWQEQFLAQWSSRIGGGTDEVQRNIIGERVLGLPREPSVDRDLPFRQTAKG